MHGFLIICMSLLILVATLQAQEADQAACADYSGNPFYNCNADAIETCQTRECCWDEETQICYHSTNTVYTDGDCTYIRVYHIDEGYATFCQSFGSVDGSSVEACLQDACSQNTEDGINAVNFDSEGGTCYIRHCEIPLIDENLELKDIAGRHIWARVLDYCESTTICGLGTCQQTSARSYSCICPEGLTGANCEEDIDDCEGVTCENGGECVDAFNNYSCDCLQGFDGTHCEIDNYNCVIDSADRIDCDCDTQDACHLKGCCWVDGSCFHGHNTTMVINSSCTYIRVHTLDEGLASYCSPDTATSSDKNSLQNCLTEVCQSGPAVFNVVNMHFGSSCFLRKCDVPLTDVNLLLDVTVTEHFGRNIWITVFDYCSDNPCDNGGVCKNTERHFVCECQPGYEGDLCQTDIQECLSSPCVHGNCSDEVNGYMCHCTAGYTGVHCELDIDECSSNPCQNGATCENHVNFFKCLCAAGYTSHLCEINIDECADTPCMHGTCIDGVNEFSCVCKTSHTGQLCEQEINECDSNPCQNEGQCSDHVDYYKCTCQPGYTGVQCEEDIDECSSSPCTGGQCTNNINSYTCTCFPGFTGINCETDIDECSSDPCMEGQCHNGVNKYSCVCSPGYTGITCSTEIDECDSNPCLHGAACTEGLNHYSCECPAGYTGLQCETDIDECSSSPCAEGQCTNNINSYRCTCSAGFTGTNCETDIDECASDPCIEGHCRDGVNGYKCECSPGYTGITCDLEIDECDSNPCLHDATCTEGVNHYSCECPAGYTGLQCETDELALGSAEAQQENRNDNQQSSSEAVGIASGAVVGIVAAAAGVIVIGKVVYGKVRAKKSQAKVGPKTEADPDTDELATQRNTTAPIRYVDAYVPNT